MLTVGNDGAEVERRLSEGRLEGPVCAAPLRGWGHGRVRVIRLAGGTGWRARPRRAICAGCGTTHVLLPAGMLARRAGSAAVIGAALAGAAARPGAPPPAPPPGPAGPPGRGGLRPPCPRARPPPAALSPPGRAP